MVANVDLTIFDNADWIESFTFVDEETNAVIPMTGSTFEMDIKTAPGAAVVLGLTSGAGDIDVTDVANGKITVTIADGAIAVGNYYYDIIQILSGVRTIRMRGAATVVEGITQP